MEAQRLAITSFFRTNFRNLTGRTSRSGWWVAGAFAFVLISSLSFAAGEIDGKPEKSDITIALPQPSGAPIPVFLAHEAGLFKKHGINAKIQILNSAVSVQAIVSGDADIFAGGATLSNARLRGAPFKFFGATTQQYVFQMYGVKEITNVQQLKGKTVAATTPRAAIETVTREVLRRAGLNPNVDVKILYLQTVGAMLTSMVSGQTSAGALSPPTTLKAREAGLNLISDIGKLNIAGLQVGFGTAESFLKNNPNTALAFLKAMASAAALARTDPTTTKRVIATYLKLDDPKMVDDTYEVFSPYWMTSLAVRVEAIQTHLDSLEEKEFPNAKSVNPKDFIDNSFVDKLSKSGFVP
jgi:NitT/TauT family transport system substrate-binding protein